VRWLPRFAAWLAVLFFLVASWAVFRAPSLGWLWGVLSASALLGTRPQAIVALITLSATGFYALLWGAQPLFERLTQRVPVLEPLFYAAALILSVVYASPVLQDFIYFRF
jgi:hypothetical protein